MVFKKKEKALETKDEEVEFVHCKVKQKCNDIFHNDKIISVNNGNAYVTKTTYDELKDIGLVE